jgi:hypothetical protein
MQDKQLIQVLPVDGGWTVDCSLSGQPLMFLSGARAEEKARSLAICLAGMGQDVRVVVHDRMKTPIGAILFSASEGGARIAL